MVLYNVMCVLFVKLSSYISVHEFRWLAGYVKSPQAGDEWPTGGNWRVSLDGNYDYF